MTFHSKGYDPETIAFLQRCLDVATEAACRLTGTDRNEALRRQLAAAIMEGANADISSESELVDFALKSLPDLRKRLAN